MADKDKAASDAKPGTRAGKKTDKAQARDQRLANALRANLEKRKSQARGRVEKPATDK